MLLFVLYAKILFFVLSELLNLFMLLLSRTFIFLLAFISLVSQANEQAQQELEQYLQANQGKVVYIDFWASWCKPCRESFPWMNDMKAKYQSEGLVIVSVNLDAEKKFATEFLMQIPANFDVIYDPKGITARKLKVKGMPSSYLINRQGQIVSRHSGFNDDKKVQFEQEIIKLLQ